MRKPSLIFLIAIVFGSSSCVIHFKFPFICFRKECLMDVFSFSGSRKDSGGKRGLKQKVSIFLSKYNAKKRRKNGKKQRESDRKESLKEQKDTIPEKPPVTYGLGKSSGICSDIKLIIKKTNDEDTLLVYFPDNTRRLTDEGKIQINICIEKIGVDSISEVRFKNCHNKNILTYHEIIWLEERERHISKHLKTLKVPKAKIKTEE
ncbi:MAG: hypothetical protein ABIP51_01365 [Bacteroidia bacterium]